jgi:hypothetical protein
MMPCKRNLTFKTQNSTFLIFAMNRYEELQALIRTFEKDFTKFYDKGNKEAGIRLRKNMQTLRAFAKSVRDEVQEKNNSTGNTNSNDLHIF